MRISRRLRWIMGTFLATIFGLAVGVFLIAWTGVYSIAASRGHFRIVEWFLAFGMTNSVELHAQLVGQPPPLDDPNLYILGAGHFHSGCTYCHGTPGGLINPVVQQMLPPPPDLKQAAKQWNDRQLFWIIKHGFKYTGMPGWVAQERDDEVWAVVAFVRRLEKLNVESYRNLALGGVAVPAQTGRDLAIVDAWPSKVNACVRCHGAEDRRPASNLAPVLHGQPRAFLIEALRSFARDERQSGMMQPIVFELNQAAIEELADYYSGLALPAATQRPARAMQDDEQGRTLATEGDPARRIPACMTCHGAEALETYPRLAGQNAAYVTGRLRRWRAGVPPRGPAETIMAPIARLLTPEQIDAVAAYFEALPATPTPGTRAP